MLLKCVWNQQKDLLENSLQKKVSAVPLISFGTSWRTMATFGIADY